MVRIVGDPMLRQVSPDLRDAIVDLSRQLIRPNLEPNPQETAARRAAAAAPDEPPQLMIKKGEMLVREGERISELQSRKIQAMQAQADTHRIPMAGIGAVALLAAILAIQYHVRLDGRIKAPQYGNKDLFFLTSVMVVLMVVVNISTTLPDAWFLGLSSLRPSSAVGFGIPLAAGAMIVCLIMGLDIALIFSLALALSATMLLQGGLETFIYFILSCTMASWWLQDCRERRVIIKAGARLGLLNALLAVIIDLTMGATAWVTLPVDVAMALIGGIGAGILTAGMAPLVEWVFGYTTDITLLEQASLDRPILRRLMVEAPGTYHHSIIVGSMVEAAATAIGANPIMAKVCGYYHDIGKLKQPLYFIENQSDGKNKHDKLAPSMSALILIAHVKNGVELARENKLGRVIIDTIEQHHGTSLISYFYAKAKAAKGENAVNIDDFRYPGPRPQTREAGIVMLADVLEAASRTLDNPTPSRINGLVRNLINNVFSDGQLDHCELTLKDLTLIADHFTKILNGIHHHRIEYQDSPSSGKSRHANTDRKLSASLQLAE
jgi:putative nucleotidyltransferase with HDIG domain